MPPKPSKTPQITLPPHFSSLSDEEKLHYYISQNDDITLLEQFISERGEDFDEMCLNYEIIPEEDEPEDDEHEESTESKPKKHPIETLLHQTARIGDRPQTFQWLLSKGANPATIVPNQPSLFHLIVALGENDTAEQYWDALETVWGNKMYPKPPVQHERNEDEEEDDSEPTLAQQPWDRGAVYEALNQIHPTTPRSPLLTALKNKHASLCAHLTNLGATHNFNTSEQFNGGSSDEPLWMFAVRVGDMPLVECLWASGVMPFGKNKRRETVLHIATQYNRRDFIDWLQKKLGGKIPEEFVMAEDVNGNTVVELASEKSLTDLLKHFTSKLGADINHKNTLDGMMSIHRASFFGKANVVDELVSAFKVKVTEVDDAGNTPLHHACARADATLTKYFIDKKVDTIVPNSVDGTTALHLAAYAGSAEIVLMLLGDKKTDVNVRNKKLETPLHMAASQGAMQVVPLLLERKEVNIELEDFQGYTPLERALNTAQEDVAVQLIERGANFERDYKHDTTIAREELAERNATTPHYTYQTLFQQAVCRGFNKVVESMIKSGKVNGTMVNRVDSNGCSPLHNAVATNNVTLTLLLLEHPEVDVNVVEKSEGHTALLMACKQGFAEIVEVLVKCDGCQLQHAAWNDGRTALHFAARIATNIESARILVEHGADVNAADLSKRTPLFDACQCDNAPMIEFLLENNASIEHQDENGSRPLHYATQYKSSSAVQVLCEHDVSLNSTDHAGRTPLTVASQFAAEKCGPIIVRHFQQRKSDAASLKQE